MPNTAAAKMDTADWTEFYRTLSTDELISRSLSLQLAVQRGHALYTEERFAGLEAEQARRTAEAQLGQPDAHEQAHREDERRWAVEQTEALGMGTYGEDTEAVQDLLVQVRRNWRLSREASKVATYAQFSQYATLSGMAATELEEEFGVEVDWSIGGGWTVEVEVS